MATLDDKLMGEKLHYYCSSSEDEDDGAPKVVPTAEDGEAAAPMPGRNALANTGPKGVIEDWRRFKQLERENRSEQEKEKAEIAKRLAMTCRTDREEQAAKDAAELEDDELLLDDDVLADFMERRMREMMLSANAGKKHFGVLYDLHDADQFLAAVDREDKEVVVVVLIYEVSGRGCEAMRGCLQVLCKDHPSTKFCLIRASTAGLSGHFKSDGVPALLVYKGGELITSFVRVTDVLGDDFYASDVESFLVEHGVLTDKELVPSIIRGPENVSSDSD